MNSMQTFISVSEVMDTLMVSRASAYRIVKRLNDELNEKGFMVIPGKVSRKYFNERFYGYMDKEV